MNKEIADKWIAALRSGDYKQGQKRLKRDDTFCCLGVLCDISGQGEWKPINQFTEMEAFYIGDSKKGSGTLLTEEIKAWSGVSSCDGRLRDNTGNSLLLLNDAGKSFAEIADLIEKNWEKL